MPKTIEDAKKAAEAAEKQRDKALAALQRVIDAEDKAAARVPKDDAVAAAAEAGRQSVEALAAAQDVNTVEARDYAERARDAAVTAETSAKKAKDLYAEKPGQEPSEKAESV
jgi:hypothetical protein